MAVAAVPALLLLQAARAAQTYPGVIALDVDASDIAHRIFRVVETIPARPGRFELYYPQWLPGEHSAGGRVGQLAGLRFRVNGAELAWQRDPLDVYHFVLNLPPGTSQLEVQFQVATPQTSDSEEGVVVTANLLNLKWNQVLLYPAKYRVSDIQVQAKLTLPAGWKYATALRPAAQSATMPVSFARVPLEILVDSPLFAGASLRQFDLTAAGGPPVTLNVVAEEAGDLAAGEAALASHRALVREAYAALGAPHYDHYDFLLALSDNIGELGLEHHRSSENSETPGYFRSWDEAVTDRDLLPHEFTHSWNGKYRRPARLWTPDYNTPMQDDLLWVYEGMTQYYGMVLAARSGLWPQEIAREQLAATAAVFADRRQGREWRSVEDTTLQPIITPRRALSWTSWQRTEDYYFEGALLWLDVDTRLRELTQGRRSLDDFAHTFFAAAANEGGVSTYELADVARALNTVAPFDWEPFLRGRIGGIRQPLPEGLERAGFRLVYNDQPNKAIADREQVAHRTDLGYSLGVVISANNVLTDVVWDGPAFKAGLTTNTTLVAVNGRAFDAGLLKRVITAAATGGPPVELIVKWQDQFRTVSIDYRGGLRYPHLESIPGRQDGLAPLLAPRAPLP